ETQIGARQRPPIHRYGIRFSAAVLVIRVGYNEISGCGNRDPNANQTARTRKAICIATRRDSREIQTVVAIRSVHGTENRVQAVARDESLLDVGGGDGHPITGLMARSAATTVGAQALEEWSGQIDRAGRAVGARCPARIWKLSVVRYRTLTLSVHP